MDQLFEQLLNQADWKSINQYAFILKFLQHANSFLKNAFHLQYTVYESFFVFSFCGM